MATIDLFALIEETDRLLSPDDFKDYAPNGLQVEGGRSINRIVTGVSACMALFEAAVEKKAQTVLVHHGMFWPGDPRTVTGGVKRRIAYLLEHDLSLIGYHLPLDRHPTVGNNVLLADALELTDRSPFGAYNGTPLGIMGVLSAPTPVASFMERVGERINPAARIHPFGPSVVRSVALVSGGAPELVREAITKRADLYLTGEESEWVYHLAKEEGIHYVAAGHHATERFGVRALGEHLAKKFGVDVEFVDIPNPI